MGWKLQTTPNKADAVLFHWEGIPVANPVAVSTLDLFNGRAAGAAMLLRAKVPGGWFVKAGESAFFYPDPAHEWDGSTLPQEEQDNGHSRTAG